MNFIIRYEHALCANKTRSARREIEHVALSEQTIRAIFIENHPAIDLGRDLERNSTGNVRLDYSGDDICARRLRRDD